VLVAPTWVLTASHCFTTNGYDPTRGPVSVKLKKVSGSDDGVVQRNGIGLVLGDGFDLALIRVDAVTDIQPIEIVSRDRQSLYKNGTVAVSVGWGGNDGATVADPGVLTEGAQTIYDQVGSMAQFETHFNYLMMTSSYWGDTAEGDSGGPLISETFDGDQIRHVLVGIDSQGSSNGDTAYTKVGSCHTWISNTIAG
jgi:secreted trypsin-like serine protease